MSRIVDLSDLSKLSEDELRYALDRHMITDEQFQEHVAGDSDDDGSDYESWSAKKLKAEYDRRVAEGRTLPEAKNKAEAIKALVDDDEAAASGS